MLYPRHLRLSTIALTVLLGSMPRLSFAQQQDSAATPWGVGIAVASTKRPYTGSGNKTMVLPVLSYEGEYVRVAGAGIDLKLGSTGPLDFAFRTKFALGDGYKSSDAPILNGMVARKGSLWAGPAVTWNADFAKISFEVLADALRKSKGIEGKLGIERNLRAGPFVFTPHAAADFVDKKYVDYYYGVTDSQATLNRPTYEGKSTINFEGGLRTAYMFNRTNSLFVDLNATALGKGITDSPLVDRKVTPTVVLGYVYRF